MTRFRFLVEALADYEDALEFYERAQPGLGETFADAVERAIALSLEFPDSGSPVADTPPELDVRRRILHRFGVELDYVVAHGELIVIATFHCKRHPAYWRERLAKLR